ncbi:hypothetical protein HOY82DRAFT_536121 [Tuber indicum]|nr:hypothetical protein HOY82DRAFT_536121 [Tuber indicum]
MDTPGDHISKKPKVTFSKQDSRHNPTSEEKSISQMMEDLGDHRIINLPLSGARVLGTAPSPNPAKGGAQNAQMALKSDHMEAWAALFDPSLVIERNDGLGEGQSYRAGPNYLPIRESKFKYTPKWPHYRSGSDTPIPPFGRGQTIPSQATRSLQIRGDQHPRRAFHGRPVGHGNGIPPKRVIWHTGNLMTAGQDLYDYIQPRIGANKSMDPLAPKAETGKSWNIQPTLKPSTTTHALRKIDSPQSIGVASHKSELEKFADAPPTTVPGINSGEARQALASQSAVVAEAKISNRGTSEIAQVASQLAPNASSDSDGNLSDTSDAGSLESRKNSNPESKPNTNLRTVFESLENEMQLTTRALSGCSFDSHDYEIKEIFNKTRLKALTDKINAADNLLSEEMAKMYEFKTSLQNIKSRSRKMTDDFLKIKMEHDEFLVKQKRIAEMEADKKAADEFALKNRVDVQPQVELRKENLLQEEQRLEEKQKLEKQWQEEKRQEEKRLEEKHQEEKRQEEKRQEEKRLEKRLEEKRQEEKRQEEGCQEKRLEEKRLEELRLGAERLEQQRLEKRRRENYRIEKWQQGPLQGEEQPQKEKQRGLDRLRYEKQQLIEKQRLDKLLNDERVKAEQTEVRRLAAQRMEGHPLGEHQEKKHAQNEAEKMLTRERLGGDKGINGLDEYTDPYGRGRIEAENAHEKFREITQVRAGHPKGGPSTQTGLKEVSHSVGTQPAAHGERELAQPKEYSDLGNAKLNPPLFPYKLHLQLTPLFNTPSITAWVGRLADPTVEIEKAIRQHLSDDEMKVLKNVEAYKEFLTKATDHHTRKLAKDSK